MVGHSAHGKKPWRRGKRGFCEESERPFSTAPPLFPFPFQRAPPLPSVATRYDGGRAAEEGRGSPNKMRPAIHTVYICAVLRALPHTLLKRPFIRREAKRVLWEK